MSIPSDADLISKYGEVRVPADRLLLDPAAGDRFIEAVAAKANGPIDRQRTLARVLTLRKQGRLPRLER